MDKQKSPTSLKLSRADQALIRKLKSTTGIQSLSDLVRLALRKLAENEGLRATQ